jgi:YVTN family beta-propeller protein
VLILTSWSLVGCEDNLDIVQVHQTKPTITQTVASPSNANESVNPATEPTLGATESTIVPTVASPSNTNESVNPATEPTLGATESTIVPTVASPSNTNESVNSAREQTVLIESHASSFIATSRDGNFVVAVNPDSDSITLLDAITLELLAEVSVGDNPKTVAITPDSKNAIVANYDSGTVSIIDLDQGKEIAQYEVGQMPYGVVTNGLLGFITEFGIGSVSVVDLFTGELLTRIKVDAFPSGIALSKNAEKLLVTHLFTGKITVINVATRTIIGITPTGLETNLSQFIAIDQGGEEAYIPQTRSNTTNLAPLFDTTVFPIVNVLDLDELQIVAKKRITLDTADKPVNMPFSIALSPSTNILYVANAGSDNVSAIDLGTNRALANLKVGSNPRGIAIMPDESRIFVNNVLDGTLSVIDTKGLVVSHTIQITNIPLNPTLLAGKKLFNSASSPALTNDNWISCASCHFDGMMDSRTWIGFPDGPRNTPALFDIGQTLPMHWSGDFDELQDVEITIQKIQFGKGLTGKPAHDSLGKPHSGLSVNLDALAAYLSSIKVPDSPFKSNHESIDQGRSLFKTLGCQTCHTPPLYTDLKSHDVGTGDPAKEKNSHGYGTKFDTPSLRGIWLTAPYLHDGSALTLEEVLQTGSTHNVFDSIDDSEVKDLINFILALPEDNRNLD